MLRNVVATRNLTSILLLLLALLGPSAAAQYAVGGDPGETADRAVEAWLAQPPVDIAQLSRLPATELCRELPGLLVSPPPESGTTVNVDDRRELDSGDEGSRLFSYSAVRPGDRLAVVQVRLERSEGGETWEATSVGYRLPSARRSWLATPAASWLFALFSLLVIYLLVSKSFLRRWALEGMSVLRAHRRIVLFTMILLYGLFALGVFAGTTLPEECGDAVTAIYGQTFDSLGLVDALGSGDVARASLAIFYQNFVVVTLTVTFGLALLFGIPAYLVSSASFFVQAIPFGLLGAFDGAQAIFLVVLILLELTAYFLVVAGGGILLATLVKQGFQAFPLAVRRLALTLPLAMILLLVAAWYEAAVLML